MLIATITIDLHTTHTDVWSQVKENLSPEQKKKFEAIKKAVERLVEQPKQLELTT